jgi:hypothetical protein
VDWLVSCSFVIDVILIAYAGYSSAIGAEATFFAILINYWAEGKVHDAVWSKSLSKVILATVAH